MEEPKCRKQKQNSERRENRENKHKIEKRRENIEKQGKGEPKWTNKYRKSEKIETAQIQEKISRHRR